MIELRHLRYAIAVADEAHLTRAAERLGLQQPPLSQQIKALEQAVGVALFHRQPRGMSMTVAGEVFMARARQILADVDGAVEEAQRAARGETGQLSIGFTTSAAFHPLVTSVVRATRLTAPALKLRLDEGSTAELLADLTAGRLDAAFIRTTPGAMTELRPLLTVETVDVEDMVLALPDTHPLALHTAKADDARVVLATLAEETFVLYRRPLAQGLYDRIIAACQAAGFSPRVAQEAPRLVSTLSLVAAGLGVSIIPHSMARLETSGVAYRRFAAGSGLEAPLSLAYRSEAYHGALERFVREVKDQVAKP
ncbi:LysR family transcriptional regulator [Allorhizobium taibaishanense]|uniref:HTH-type transcriptional regulator TtuA n=1 Tax=Allorhizobium taibaishanense TaxID=887144 RepID=A0A1Q9A8M0_9HYPH|nr:LysR family transcriptional regulator [Allorhizobium taibaishanense]MBB4009529.1 DNA-binding transcriptional LysR family regulator [Allorhizobium taibaishanense]OLP50938.1 LysR family transcriptional regulator [Allorhizobium taibaishanense]